MKSLKFDTIRALSARKMDLLILIPSDMDANRNEHNYFINTDNHTMDEALGNDTWREEWEDIRATMNRTKFGDFFVKKFCESMSRIDRKYIIDPTTFMPIKNDANRRIYQLAFFSESDLGTKFWGEAKKYSEEFRQMKLLF